MNIVVSSDNNFSDYVIVLMNSVYKNHEGIICDFYIIGTSLEKAKKKRLVEFANKNNQNIYFLEITDYEGIFRTLRIGDRFSSSTYATLILHELLPETCDRCLFLDADIIVTKNILDFYNLDFEENYLIAASNGINYSEVQKCNKKYSKAINGEYFNSGVMIYNLNLFRENINLDTWIRTINEVNGRYSFDQGLMNILFYDKTKYVNPLLYNFRYSLIASEKNKSKIKELYGIMEKQIKDIPYIIHFNGALTIAKPWDLYFNKDEIKKYKRGIIFNPKDNKSWVINEEENYYSGLWWKYAEETPIYDELYSKMLVKKEWYKRQIREMISKYYVLAKELYMKNRENEIEIIKRVQDRYNATFLESIGIINNIPLVTNIRLKAFKTFNEYIDFLFSDNSPAYKNITIVLCALDECSRMWKYFNTQNEIGIKKGLVDKYRYAYICIINKSDNFIYEEVNKDSCEKEFCLGEKHFVVKSEGYSECGMESNITDKLTNVDYCMNMRGLNVVVFNNSTACPIDSFNVDFYSDKELKIRRNYE